MRGKTRPERVRSRCPGRHRTRGRVRRDGPPCAKPAATARRRFVRAGSFDEKSAVFLARVCTGFASIFGTFYLMREAHRRQLRLAQRIRQPSRRFTDRVRRTADTIKELKEQNSPSDGAAVNASLLDSIEKALAQLDKEKRQKQQRSSSSSDHTV